MSVASPPAFASTALLLGSAMLWLYAARRVARGDASALDRLVLALASVAVVAVAVSRHLGSLPSDAAVPASTGLLVAVAAVAVRRTRDPTALARAERSSAPTVRGRSASAFGSSCSTPSAGSRRRSPPSRTV